MALNIDFNLQVEDPTGSNNWILAPGGVTRQTGTSAHYRIFYSFSSTDSGTFNDMAFVISFPDDYYNLQQVRDVGLPAGASYQTQRDGGTLLLMIQFAQALPPGQTGFIEFSMDANAPAGPDGYQIVPHIALGGEFQPSGAGEDTPIDQQAPGPSWTVDCALYDRLQKTVTNNGQIYVPDEDAYIVDYQVWRFAEQPVPGTNQDLWSVDQCQLVETLPTILGVTPQIVWSDRPYTVASNTVTWDYAPYDPVYGGVYINFRVRYPKDQVDALGGPAALGQITDSVQAQYILRGGVPADLDASATLELLPTPAPQPGALNLYKVADPAKVSGAMLEAQDVPMVFTLHADVAGGNMIPQNMRIVDINLQMVLEDGSSHAVTADEVRWDNVLVEGDDIQFEYRTDLGGATNWTLDPAVVGRVLCPFPTVPAGDHINAFRATCETFTHPGDGYQMLVYLTLLKRDAALPKIVEFVNTMTASAQLENTATLTGAAQVEIPVDYGQVIVTNVYSATVNSPTVNPGGTAGVATLLDITTDTTAPVYGTDLFVIIPPGFTLTQVNADYPLDPSQYDVTLDWMVQGQSLLHVPVQYDAITGAGSFFGYSLICDVDPGVVPGTYPFEFWYLLNPTQANNPDIIHYAADPTAPDIYDFDHDGDVTELVAMRTLPVLVTAGNEVNVLKYSKSVRDDDFAPDNDTQITAGELFQYQLSVRNDSPDPMTDLVMIDIFPYEDDAFSSMWAPILKAPIVDQPGVTIQYALTNDPIMAPVGPGGTGAWQQSPPLDIAQVRAVRFDFGERVFMPGESAVFVYSMMAPPTAPDGGSCYNSVQYVASAIKGGVKVPYLPAFSPPAYAKVTYRDTGCAIGDFVWVDLNENGVQDPGEPGLNGVSVRLYDQDGDLMYETKSANSPIDGGPGYYLFDGIWPGTYSVQFPTVPYTGYALTLQHAGGDPEKDSDPDPMTGRTDPIALAQDEMRLDIDAGYIRPQPVPCQDELCQAIADLIESVAMEQAALAHILNAEGEKLQFFLKLDTLTPKALLQVNQSVQATVDAISQLELVLHAKLALIPPDRPA